MGNYVVMTTAEMDDKTKFPKKPGQINGGFYKKSDMAPSPSVVIAVDDIKESIKKVKDAGGKIMPNQHGKDEAVDIPGIGLYISFIDSEGNRASMLQPSQMM
jgi:predicted enzyme related to lactoylglutathione lyase